MRYVYSINDAMKRAEYKVSAAGWVAWQWESVEGGQIVRGSIPGGVYQRGPKKGKPKFNHPATKDERTVLVSDEEMQIVAAEYERETGNCWVCKGTGKVFSGWSRDEGVRYRPCSLCVATGKPVSKASASDS